MAKTKEKNTEVEEEHLDPVFNPATGAVELVEKAADQDTQDEWLDESYEGQLAVDVYQAGEEIVIKSTIAGVRAQDIDVDVNNDMVTIKGIRHEETEQDSEYFYRECYWGGFSRSIILPVDVRQDNVKATLKSGVLTVRLMVSKPQQVNVEEIEDEDK
ncbi:MAG: Hsp20/alpha crystallin family protein [Patescibacteria group bacterium]|jgi:HSP20 family protein